jgi:hypothetical protein
MAGYYGVKVSVLLSLKPRAIEPVNADPDKKFE